MTPFRSTLSRLALCLCLAAFAGCGGGGPIVRDVTPFTAEHEPAFENGLDMVRDPEALGGAWLRTWEDEIDRRVSLADVVALVTVKTFRTDVDLERNETYRLVTQVDREYLGELEDAVEAYLAAADRMGTARFVSQQIHYTLEAREAEYELAPIAVSEGVGILVWGPIAGGLLILTARGDLVVVLSPA